MDSLPNILTIFIVIITFLYCLLIGIKNSRNIDSIEDYFFYGRNLDQRGYQKTFIVTGISLATVLFFFLDYGKIFGLSLILSPLMFCLGTWIFYLLLPRLEKDGFISDGTTLHNYIGRAFDSSSMRYLTGIISIVGYLGIFVIEIFVGITIFSFLTGSSIITTLISIILMVFIFLYVYLGGIKAVIDTDKFQFILISIGTILSIGILLFIYQTTPPVQSIDFFPYSGFLPLPFIIVMVVGNVPFQILRMAHWQRAASVGDVKIVQKGLKKGIIFSFIFWAAFLVLGLLLHSVYGINDSGVISLLTFLKSESFITSYIILPIVFSALLAALISTSDSTFIAILTTYIYDFKLFKLLHDKHGNRLINLEDNSNKLALITTRKSIIYIMLLGGVLYYSLVEIFKFEFIDLLFVFFNQQLALFPAVITAIYAPSGKAKTVKNAVFIGVFLGWVSVWAVSIYGKSISNQDLVLYSAPIGWLSSIIITFFISPKAMTNIILSKKL